MPNVYLVEFDNIGRRQLLVLASSAEIATRKAQRKQRQLVAEGELDRGIRIAYVKALGSLDVA